MSKIRVILADDNREFAELLKEHLTNQEDIEVIGVAHHGGEVVDLLQRSTPDVLVLDIIMPHLDGLGVLEKIQQLHLEPDRKSVV